MKQGAQLGPAASEEQRANGILDILIILTGRKKLIGTVTLGVMVLTAMMVLLVPNRYTAGTKILPPQQNQSLSSMLATQLGSMGPLASVAGRDLGLKNPNDMYVGLLKSHSLENALISRFDLMHVYKARTLSDAREKLEAATTITAGKDGFITIAVEDKDRKRAAAVTNAYVEELRKLMQRIAVTEAGQRRLFFEEQMQEVKSSLVRAEQALKDVQQRTGIIQLDGQTKAIVDAVVRLRAEVAAKEVQVGALRSFGTERNPEVILANQELAGLRAQLQKLEHQQNSGSGDIQVPVGNVPEAGLEYLRRVRDIKYYEVLFELLAKQYEMARLDEAKQGASMQVIDPAVEPDRKSSPHRASTVLLMGILAILMACLFVVFSDFVAKSPDRARLYRVWELTGVGLLFAPLLRKRAL